MGLFLAIKNLFRALMVYLFAFPVRLYIGYLSLKRRVQTYGKPNNLIQENPYAGQNIMVLALYQKGELRADVKRLLAHAKSAGLYVIAVNTQRLSDPSAISELVDCYYEKPNFGRDFGSYQTGFVHVFDRKLHETCSRLMMLNDSIFFSDERMPQFLADMMDPELEVLGSTENFDIEYHLGSFCIAMNQSILKHPDFEAYWRGYRLSDVRPTVIHRGELELSKVLKKVMKTPSEITALYSANRFYESVRNDEELFDFVLKNARTSDIFAWKRVDARQIASKYREAYLQNALDEEIDNLSIEVSEDQIATHWQLRTLKDVENYISQALLTDKQKIDAEALFEVALKEAIESFLSGSQIHQNAAVLLRLGLPIVKLDGLYRGIFDMSDVYRVTQQLDGEEQKELRSLLMSRPYGRRYYVGWRRVAFERGYI